MWQSGGVFEAEEAVQASPGKSNYSRCLKKGKKPMCLEGSERGQCGRSGLQILGLRMWWKTWIGSDLVLHSGNYWKKNLIIEVSKLYSLLPPNINHDYHSLGSYYVPGTDYLRHWVVLLPPELRVLPWASFSIDGGFHWQRFPLVSIPSLFGLWESTFLGLVLYNIPFSIKQNQAMKIITYHLNGFLLLPLSGLIYGMGTTLILSAYLF